MTLTIPSDYKGASINVIDNYPGLSGDMWVAMWHYTSPEDFVISLERDYVERLRRHARKDMEDAQKMLTDTLEHEHAEAVTTMKLAIDRLLNADHDLRSARQYAMQNFTGHKTVSWFEQLAGDVHEKLEPPGSDAEKHSLNALRRLGYRL